MKFLMLFVLLAVSMFANELKLKDGSVSALTGVLGDAKINPQNNFLNAKLSMSGNELTSIRGTISVEMLRFKSDNEDRDENMYQTLESDKFTYSTYTINNIISTETKDNYVLNGNLKLHGVIKPVNFDAIITQNGTSITIDAKTKINVEDYNIDMPCLLGFTMCVDENVNIHGVTVLEQN